MAALFPKRKKPGFCLGKPRRSTNARPLLFIRTKETALEYTRAVSRDSALGGAQKLGTRLQGVPCLHKPEYVDACWYAGGGAPEGGHRNPANMA